MPFGYIVCVCVCVYVYKNLDFENAGNGSFETSEADFPVTQLHIAEKQNPQSYRYKNLRTRQRY